MGTPMRGDSAGSVRVFTGAPLQALCDLAIQFCAEAVRAGGTVEDVQIVEGENGLEVHVRWNATRHQDQA